MKIKIFLTLALCAAVGSAHGSWLFGGDDDSDKTPYTLSASAKTFFQSASKGDYKSMINQITNQQLSPTDMVKARDDNGNSPIGAAIAGFPQASAAMGEAAATVYLSDIIKRALPVLNKNTAAAMLNDPNKDGMTPLLIAAQYDLLKIAVILHGQGGLSVLKSGKKASDYAKQLKTLIIVRGWEAKDADAGGDWTSLISGGGDDSSSSLADKIKGSLGGLTGSKTTGDTAGTEASSSGSLLDQAKQAAGSLVGGK